MARGGAQAVTLGGVTGAQGVIAVQQPWTQPYFDRRRVLSHLPCPARAGRPGGMRTAGDQRHAARHDRCADIPNPGCRLGPGGQPATQARDDQPASRPDRPARAGRRALSHCRSGSGIPGYACTRIGPPPDPDRLRRRKPTSARAMWLSPPAPARPARDVRHAGGAHALAARGKQRRSSATRRPRRAPSTPAPSGAPAGRSAPRRWPRDPAARPG